MSQKRRVPSWPRNGPGSGSMSRTIHSISGMESLDRGIEVPAVEGRVALADALDEFAQRWSIGT